MMKHMYVGDDWHEQEFKKGLRFLVPDAAEVAAVAAVEKAYRDYVEDPAEDEELWPGTVLYDVVVPALEANGVDTHVIDEELDCGYVLVVQF